jgi:mRNA interferase RelE/StbE
MMFRVALHPGARREFNKLPKDVKAEIAPAINELAENPRPNGSVKLAGMDAYRLKVGAYRVAYTIHDERLVVLIVKVAHRREIYREVETIRQRLKTP